MAIGNWAKIWNGKNVVRFQNNNNRHKSLEVFSAKVGKRKLWFIALITKNKIKQVPTKGFTKMEALKKATMIMAKTR